MDKLSGQLRLRPTRIGFLLRPTDMRSLRRILRLCACLWGGAFNPLIPVCRVVPKAWRREAHVVVPGPALTHGYIGFFEPDVYVEAEAGLADECGIDRITDSRFSRRVVTLDDFVIQDPARLPEFAFGLSVFDLYQNLYATDYKFASRHDRPVVLFEGGGPDATFIEAVAGGFPDDARLSFFRQVYLDAFEPNIQKPSPENWISALQSSAGSPLGFTEHGIDRHPDRSWNPCVFVADPRSPLDMLDLWNLRQFHGNVLPLNMRWLADSRDFLRDFIERHHRPLPGNPNGVMIHTTIEFGRSIDPERVEDISKTILDGLPPRSCVLKTWYDPIWNISLDDMVLRRERAVIEAKSQRLDFSLESTAEPVVTFPSLFPEFAEQFGGNRARWVNVIRLTELVGNSGIALALPSTPRKLLNLRMRRGQDLIVSREGFAIPQRHKDHTQFLRLLRGPNAISEWLRERGIEATPSDSGRIADQLLSAVGGFWGAHVLSDAETIKLLDKMSKSVHIHREGSRSEEYPARTAHVSEWMGLVRRRQQQPFTGRLNLQSFVKAGALRLGLAIDCPHCEYENWYGIGHLNERVVCERCLREYDFPQGTLNFGNAPWRYRVTGPFSVPNYADGAYSTVLALRCLAEGLGGGRNPVTYSSNLNLKIDGQRIEVDFACWYARERITGLSEEPLFVVGETKSFADEAVQDVDVNRLRLIGTKLPGTVLVVAVLKDALSSGERKRIGRLAMWGREPMADGRWTAPVVVLTGMELLAPDSVEHQWTEAGGCRQELAEPGYFRMDNLVTLAELTQQVYLGLPSYVSWYEGRTEKRRGRHKKVR